jgi:integrase
MPVPAGTRVRKPKVVSTQKQVDAARPGIYHVTDVKRLYLKKTTKKTGSYFLRYRTSERALPEPGEKKGKLINRARPEMGLGSIADVSLDKARGMAEEAAAKIRQGINPRNGRAVLAGVPGVLTLAQAVQLYLDAIEKAKAWKRIDSCSNWFNPIKYHALPMIGHLPVEAVQTDHVHAMLDACTEKKLQATGIKIRSKLSTVFNWLRGQSRYSSLPNPFEAKVINDGRLDKGKRQTKHYRRIKLDEAPGVFQQLKAVAEGSTAISCWLFMALTAARPGEALAAKWSEIDLDKKVWVNPMSKTEKPLEVPLSDLAVEILRRQKNGASPISSSPTRAAAAWPARIFRAHQGGRRLTPVHRIAGARSAATQERTSSDSGARLAKRRWAIRSVP